MKLIKDKYNRYDLNESEKRIISEINNFIKINELIGLKSNMVNNYIYLTKITNNIPPYKTKINNFNEFMNNEYKILDTNNKPNYKLNFEIYMKEKFQNFMFNKLNDFDKIVFIKTIIYDSMDSIFFKETLRNLNQENFWSFYRNISPFVVSSKSSTDVRMGLEELTNRSINTKDKVLSFAYYLKYYQQISKRTDIKAGIIKILRNKVEEKYYPIFEKILSSKIISNETNNIFIKPNEMAILIINKEKIFEYISFENIEQAQTYNYNKYINCINKYLMSSEVKNKLGINCIDFIEFSSKKEPAKIYIESNKTGFNVNIEEMYLHFLESCTKIIKSIDKDNQMKNILDTALNFYLLKNEINKKNMIDSKNKSLLKI